MLEGVGVFLANMMMLWISLGTLLLELIKPTAGHDPAQPWRVLFPHELEEEVVSHLPVGFFVCGHWLASDPSGGTRPTLSARAGAVAGSVLGAHGRGPLN